MPFTIDEGPGARTAPVLRLSGELDSEQAPSFAAAVREQLAGSPASLVVDLTHTTYLDSRGARELAVTARLATDAGTALQVVCPRENRRLWRVFDLLGLPAAVPITEVLREPGGRP